MHTAQRFLSLLVVALSAALILAMAACGKEEEAPASSPTKGPVTSSPTPARPMAAPEPTPTAKGVARQSRMDSPDLQYTPPKLLEAMKKYHPDSRKAPEPYNPTVGGIVQSSGGTTSAWDTLKPSASSHHAWSLLGSNLVQPAESWGDDLIILKPKPDLAEKWDLSADGKTWTFYLYQGLKWPPQAPVNGRPVTADDIKFALDKYFFESWMSREFADIDRVEVVDGSTVRIIGKRPIPNLIESLMSPYVPVFSKECYETPKCLETTPVGLGAFMLDHQTPNVEQLVVRNPNYHLTDPKSGLKLPFLDGYRKIAITDPAALMAALRTGKLDAHNMNASQFFDIVKTFPDANYQLDSGATEIATSEAGVHFRLDKAPFKDVRVRRAMSMSIDRDTIIQSVNEQHLSIWQPVPYYERGFDFPPFSTKQVAKFLQYNPQEARTLLAEAGYPNGFKVKVWNAGWTAGAPGPHNMDKAFLYIMETWKKDLNIDIELQAPPDNVTARGTVAKGTFDEMAFLWPKYPLGSRPDWAAYHQLHSNGLGNFAKISDPKMDALLEKLIELPRRSAERAEVARQVEAYYEEQLWFLPTVEPYRYGYFAPWLINVASFHDHDATSWNMRSYWSGWIDCEKAKKGMEAGRIPSACK